MKIALVYDRANKIGGAERILTALHTLYPDAPLYTLVHDAERASWTKDWHVITSFLQRIPIARKYHEFFPIVPIFAFEQFDFGAFDVVISVTATEAKGIIVPPHVLHICYLLTPTRFLWSHYFEYFEKPILRMLASPFVSFLRMWDVLAAQRPDHLVTISQTSKKRITKYYKRDAEIIYPPVNTKKFRIKNEELRSKEDNYFLIVSRLVRYKRIDIAIEACNALQLPLRIVGDGMERKSLEKLAGPTIEFMGNLTDETLTHYYQNCRALLFPQEEDFGITAVEALACGKPVIAYGRGGAGEIIEPGKNGELFFLQTTDALIEALETSMKKKYSQPFCRKSAEKYSEHLFLKKFGEMVERIYVHYARS